MLLQQTKVENLYVIPATISLAGAEIELVSTISREVRLKHALEELKMIMISSLLIALHH